MTTKYRATFPGRWGDPITRIYGTRAAAIGQARRHLAACEDGNASHRAEVHQIDLGPDGRARGTILIWEKET